MLVNTLASWVSSNKEDSLRNHGSDDTTEFLGNKLLTEHTAIDHRVRVHVYLPEGYAAFGHYFHYVLDNDSVPYLL